MNNPETKVDFSSAGHSSPVALVTASNLRNDTLCVPQDSCPTESTNDGTQRDNNREESYMNLESERKKQRRRGRTITQKKFMTLRLAHDSLKVGRQYLSSPLMRANDMTRLGLITLVGRDGVKWQVNLRGEKFGRLCLGRGWKEFAKANGIIKTGDLFTLEFVWENGIQMLRLVNTESASNIREIGESSKAMEEEFMPTEACNINQADKDKNNIDEMGTNTSSLVQNQQVTLALVPEDVRAGALYQEPWRKIGESSNAMEEEFTSTKACNISQADKEKDNIDEMPTNTSALVQNRKVTLSLAPEDVKAGALYLPGKFVTAVGIKKLGKITLLGKDKMKLGGFLLSRDGTVVFGCGWRNFCKANGVTTGGSFTLEFINEEEDTGPVFNFCPNSGG